MGAPRLVRENSPLVAHLRGAIDLSELEIAALESLERGAAIMSKKTTLHCEGDTYKAVLVVKEGWAIRHKDLPDGRRQVLDFVLPGDLVGIEGAVQRIADHAVSPLTDLCVSRFSLGRVEELMRQQPRLVAALVWYGGRQRAIFAEHLLSVGRRSAYERLAHLLAELWCRLKGRGLGGDQSFRMPVTQAVLADALGLSVEQVNRSLRKLSQDGLLTKDRDTVSIIDLAGLVEAADFEASYLHGSPMPDDLLQALERGRANRVGPVPVR